MEEPSRLATQMDYTMQSLPNSCTGKQQNQKQRKESRRPVEWSKWVQVAQQIAGTRNRISFSFAEPIPYTLLFVSFSRKGCEQGVLNQSQEVCVYVFVCICFAIKAYV